jgi:hypothetical protein
VCRNIHRESKWNNKLEKKDPQNLNAYQAIAGSLGFIILEILKKWMRYVFFYASFDVLSSLIFLNIFNLFSKKILLLIFAVVLSLLRSGITLLKSSNPWNCNRMLYWDRGNFNISNLHNHYISPMRYPRCYPFGAPHVTKTVVILMDVNSWNLKGDKLRISFWNHGKGEIEIQSGIFY